MSKSRPKIWLSYAWVDNEQGDFNYLVQELANVGVEAKYDRVSLIPGQILWDQIGRHITEGDIDGWGYLITPNSINNRKCRDELYYALQRALEVKGQEFPLIGVVHNVKFADVPPALSIRLCIDLASPNWKEQIKAGLQQRPPQVPKQEQSRYVWTIHNPYLKDPNLTAIEVRPRIGDSISSWRFYVPKSASLVSWGHGASGGKHIKGMSTSGLEGTIQIEGNDCRVVGAGDELRSQT
jgi:hypothetical protein